MKDILLVLIFALLALTGFSYAEDIIKNPDGTFQVSQTVVISNVATLEQEVQKLARIRQYKIQTAQDCQGKLDQINNIIGTEQTRIQTMNSL